MSVFVAIAIGAPFVLGAIMQVYGALTPRNPASAFSDWSLMGSQLAKSRFSLEILPVHANRADGVTEFA